MLWSLLLKSQWLYCSPALCRTWGAEDSGWPWRPIDLQLKTDLILEVLPGIEMSSQNLPRFPAFLALQGSQQSNPSDGHGSGQRNSGTLWSLLVHRTSAGVYNDWHHWKGWTTPVHLAKESSAKLIYLLVTPVINGIPSHAAALNLLTTYLCQP